MTALVRMNSAPVDIVKLVEDDDKEGLNRAQNDLIEARRRYSQSKQKKWFIVALVFIIFSISAYFSSQLIFQLSRVT
jgi:hypothetical protein